MVPQSLSLTINVLRHVSQAASEEPESPSSNAGRQTLAGAGRRDEVCGPKKKISNPLAEVRGDRRSMISPDGLAINRAIPEKLTDCCWNRGAPESAIM